MKQASADVLARLRASPFVPLDYVAWLESKGCGRFGQMRFMLYDGLIRLSEIHPGAPADVWTFGDDFGGVSACFTETGGGLVYEWDSSTAELHPTSEHFGRYIQRYAIAV